MSRRENFDAGHGKDEFRAIMQGEFGEDSDEYLSVNTVECDHCGQDVHMDDAVVVKNPDVDVVTGRQNRTKTNLYCSHGCSEEGRGRRGSIGPGLL